MNDMELVGGIDKNKAEKPFFGLEELTEMKVVKLNLGNFRLFNDDEVFIGNRLTAIAGNNGTGKSTILGILANSSQLRGKKTLLGKPYRGEFSELFSADREHDFAGKKVHMYYEEKGHSREVDFRTAWQNGGRFRVIPKRKRPNGTTTESKIESPVIYLGLSRLYPVGETISEVTAKSRRWNDAADEEWFNENYSKILSIHEQIKSVSSLSISGLSSKSGTGIETEKYGPIANSSGQDNLGQILLAVLSFKKLRVEMGDGWDGGLLLIDEVDASLHPAAQIRLLKLLLDESKTSEFQIVFTTHSTVILKELSDKNQFNPLASSGDIEVAYLSFSNGRLRSMRNPSWATLENGLYVTNPALYSRRIGVFTEDPEARWLMKGMLEVLCPAAIGNLDFLEVSLGCKEIASLYSSDFSYFREKIVVFDGDVTEEEIAEDIPPAVRAIGGNIVFLPGRKRPESVLWDYLSKKPSDDSALWKDLEVIGITWESLVETPPYNMRPGDTERNKYKHWLRLYESFFDRARVIRHWVADNDAVANEFIVNFIAAYNNVAKRVDAPTLILDRMLGN